MVKIDKIKKKQMKEIQHRENTMCRLSKSVHVHTDIPIPSTITTYHIHEASCHS